MPPLLVLGRRIHALRVAPVVIGVSGRELKCDVRVHVPLLSLVCTEDRLN
jgi:hypothetical protein